jgi:hypothetical protein
MHFLVVGVPFHSQYLRDAADKVISQDLDSGLRPPNTHRLIDAFRLRPNYRQGPALVATDLTEGTTR